MTLVASAQSSRNQKENIMLILGLCGSAGCGKNTVADYLAEKYGFVSFAFSSALYHEVQQAFGLETQDLLRDRATKEVPSEALSMKKCTDKAFVDRMQYTAIVRSWAGDGFIDMDQACSPRVILQWWGTEYKRAQDPNYWVKRAAEFVTQMHYLPPYPELRPQLFVEAGTRFANEREWIRHNYMADAWQGGTCHAGQIWHVHRDATDKLTDTHASAKPLPILPGEREIWNNSTIEHLHLAVDLLFSTSNQFVRCDPPLPNGQYYKTQSDGREMLCNADGTRSVFDDVDE